MYGLLGSLAQLLYALAPAQIPPLSIDELVAFSETIVDGTVVGLHGTAQNDLAFGNEVAIADVSINRILRSTVRRSLGGKLCVEFLPGLGESPSIRDHERYIFFLTPGRSCYRIVMDHRGILRIVGSRVRTVEIRGESEWQDLNKFSSRLTPDKSSDN